MTIKDSIRQAVRDGQREKLVPAVHRTKQAYYEWLASELGSTSEYVSVQYKRALREAIKQPIPLGKKTEPLDLLILKDLRAHRGAYVPVQDLAIDHAVNPDDIEAALSGISARGFNVQYKDGAVALGQDIPKSAPTVIDVSRESKNHFRVGLVSDNHLASKYARLDVLSALYDLFAQEGVTTVYNCGNWIDGDARFNRHDLLVHGIQGQLGYFLQHYPQREGITTYLIAGDDHEGWYTQREGIDVGRYMQMLAEERGRQDLKYLGYMEHDIIMQAERGETVLRLLHPGGGSSYAVSYTPQKIVESYQGGEKPHILLIGHYHKASYNLIRGVHVVQAGCTQDQSPFMRKKRLAAHLGGWILEWWTDEVGAITRFKQEFIPFYNRDFYENKWRYQMEHQEMMPR